MAHQELRGTLHLVVRPDGRPEALAFTSLQGLLDLCAAQAGAAAFLRVEVLGDSQGRARRLVLDFGQFSGWPE